MHLDRIPADPGDPGNLSNGDSAALATELEDTDRKLGQIAEKNALAFDFFLEPVFLFLERSKEI